MVAVDLASICGPDLVTWFWYLFLCVPPMAIVVLRSNFGRKVIALCIAATKGHLGHISPLVIL